MTRVLVDSNVLLDIFTEDERWYDWSARALDQAGDAARVVINPIIYGEISVRFTRIETLDDVLAAANIHRESLEFNMAFLAAKAFRAYRTRGGPKRSPLPDFYIGAHAVVAGYRLLTRDATLYRTFFPGLQVIAPG
jgi:predicted nucleic acid-binding protein